MPLFLSVLGLAACADGPEIATPTTGVPPAFTLDAGAVCDGTGVPAVECGALVDLYHSTGGDDRIGRTGGAPTRIRAAGSASRVQNNALDGGFPVHLGVLPNLTRLKPISRRSPCSQWTRAS